MNSVTTPVNPRIIRNSPTPLKRASSLSERNIIGANYPFLRSRYPVGRIAVDAVPAKAHGMLVNEVHHTLEICLIAIKKLRDCVRASAT